VKNSIRTGMTWGEFQQECDISNENSGKLRKGGNVSGTLESGFCRQISKNRPIRETAFNVHYRLVYELLKGRHDNKSKMFRDAAERVEEVVMRTCSRDGLRNPNLTESSCFMDRI